MAEARVKAGMWVSAALRLAFSAGGGGAVLRRGDEDAGGILAVLRGREGLMVLSQVSTPEGERAPIPWARKRRMPTWRDRCSATPISG